MFVLVLCVAGTVATTVTPIEKVVTMLEDIQLQIITEGKAEAITYDKFACFCKDTTADKSEAVTEGEDYVDEYTASIGQLSADRDEADVQISELTSKISKLDKALTLEKERRHKEFTEFSALEAEISMGVRILTNTIADMKAAGGAAALLKVKSHIKTIRKVFAMAEAMGQVSPKHFREMNSFLEQPEVPMQDYSFHSTDIISTLDSFLQEFKTKLSELKIADTKHSADHDFVIQTKGAEKYALEKDLRRAKKLHAGKMKEIATANADLTWAQSTLTDDQAFLKEVTTRCNAKAKMWDQRSTMRKDELTAITSALTIIKTKVAKPSAALNAVSSKTVRLPAPEEIDEEDADEDREEEEADDSLAFVQVAQTPRKHINVLAARMANQGTQESLEPYKQALILDILKKKSQELKSKDLAMLVNKIKADPFAKIRKLIQEMIEKLLQEAADEANHKGWCDKEISKSTESRDLKVAEVRKLNSALAENEAKRDVIEEEMTKLSEAISKLEDALAEATKERADESAENAAVVTEAQEGKEAIEQAITVLDDFYKQAKAGASFAQKKQPVDMPDAGFEGEYTGVGGGTGGVMGMMEVIKSDFEREISETEAAEKASSAEFFEFQGSTKMSISTKTVTKTAHETELTEVNSALAEDKQSMEEEQDLLDKALQSLLELQPACVGETMSYGERVAAREQEIESLKTTLCVLDKSGPVQTEAECANSDASAMGM